MRSIRSLKRRAKLASQGGPDYADMPAADFERCCEIVAENERLARRVQRWPMVMTTPRGWESPELLVKRLSEGFGGS